MKCEHQNVVQIEIGVEKLESLFDKGELCAFELRCLNRKSKTCIWNLCLTSCTKNLPCHCENSAYCQQAPDNFFKETPITVSVSPTRS